MEGKYKINTSQNVNIDYEISGIGDRVIAFLIDSLIMTAFIFFAVMLSDWLDFSSDARRVYYAVIAFISFLFFFIFEVSMRGQSIGKKYRNIRVIHRSGSDASVFQYFLRNLIRPIDSIYGLGLLVILLNKRSQRLGDLAAGTILVKMKDSKKFASTIFSDLNADYTPVFDKINVLRLEEKDVVLIKQLVNRDSMKINWKLVALMTDKVKQKTGIDSDMKNMDFLRVMIQEFNYHSMH